MYKKIIFTLFGWLVAPFVFLLLIFISFFRKFVFFFRKTKGLIAIITRDDIFPVDHGAAVKIVYTAKSISYLKEVILITQDKDYYYLVRRGLLEKCEYPFIMKWCFYIPRKFLRKLIELKGVPLPESWQFTSLIDLNFILRVFYLSIRYNIVIFQAEFPGFFYVTILTSLFLKHISNYKRAIVEHNIEFERIKCQYEITKQSYERIKRWELNAIKKSDFVITVSENDKTTLVNYGIKTDKIYVIPHGVDLENLKKPDVMEISEIRKKYGISSEEIVLIFHGVLCYAPNYEALKIIKYEILPKLKNKGFDKIRFLVVGRYPPMEFQDEKIVFTDSVDNLAPYLYSADIAVVPLLSGGGTRLKILEYFATSLPVICTSKACEGIKVENGKEVVIANDFDKMVEEIIKMIKNESWRKFIGNNGYNFVQEFDWGKIGKQYFELYKPFLEDTI